MKRVRMKPDPHSRLERAHSLKDRIAKQLVLGRNSHVDICTCQGQIREYRFRNNSGVSSQLA